MLSLSLTLRTKSKPLPASLVLLRTSESSDPSFAGPNLNLKERRLKVTRCQSRMLEIGRREDLIQLDNEIYSIDLRDSG